MGKGIGHFFGAMQIESFMDKNEFKKQIDEWLRVFIKGKLLHKKRTAWLTPEGTFQAVHANSLTVLLL
ncbi:MAG: hypothetical protein ACREQW_09480 [Candidatus Binatia bacterium]